MDWWQECVAFKREKRGEEISTLDIDSTNIKKFTSIILVIL